MSSFSYTKVSSDSSQLASLEQQSPSRNVDCACGWRKATDSVQCLRWPVALFLLIVILICELLILRGQHTPLELGGEVNDLVPKCKSVRQLVCL